MTFYGRPQCASAQTLLWDFFLFLLLHGTIYMYVCRCVSVCVYVLCSFIINILHAIFPSEICNVFHRFTF